MNSVLLDPERNVIDPAGDHILKGGQKGGQRTESTIQTYQTSFGLVVRSQVPESII
jgi:hypothetical protein